MSRYIITHVSYRIAQKAFNPSKKKKIPEILMIDI